ncbi:MAG: DEAD/DEAH box helicase, partial [Bdellovibrionota bacterium]
GLGKSFLVDIPEKRITFHLLEDQLKRLATHAPRSATEASKVAEPNASHVHHDALETGLALHLTGHSVIQATAAELSEILAKDGRNLAIHPGSIEVPIEDVQPGLFITGDGSFRFLTKIKAFDTNWEAHGLPQSCFYALMGLQLGLGATTGYANSAIAYARKGLKRERDIKVLRHLGFALMIFHDAVSFAMGERISDGTQVTTKEELLESIYHRIGGMILKSEGWPTQVGSLAEVCSKNVTTLIEGFVSQLIMDVTGEGRPVHVYLPKGEAKVAGLTRATILFFHALTSDLVTQTGGSCFGRARTKYFENFLHGRTMPEREDIVLREEVDAETAAKLIYQPGINERFMLPETSIPPRCFHVFSLMNRGFHLSIDGKSVESFEASDFRPEFTLKEEEDSEVIPLGNQKINWFELHPKFFFKGTEISTEQATRLSKDGMLEFQGKIYRVNTKDMPTLKRLNQFWASIQAPGSGLIRAGRRKTEDTYYQLPRSQTLELLALRASGVKMRGGPKWEEITKFYDSLGAERPMFEIPASFRTKLQPYQHSGVQWLRDLYQLGLGGILADDMGLGKTVTTLAFLESLRSEKRMGKVLVLVPTSLTFNWLSEAEKFTPEIPVLIYSSRAPEAALDFVQSRENSIVICTYGLLQENSEVFEQVAWDTIVFDEAQSLKNITTKRTTAARKLRAQFKLCLTGTPLENHYGEFYSLFDLIVPGSLGLLPDFREKYVNPTRVLREDVDFLRLKSRPLLMRRTKAQVMSQLPAKVETTIKLPFEDEQKKIYRDIATAYNEQIRSQIALHGEAKMQLQMLTALLRLRQACSDPSAIPGVNYGGEPPKITTLIDALGEITAGGASALVFTQFLATFDRIRKSLAAAKIPHWDISGADSRLAREKKLRSFQEATDGAVMLMTLKTGGVGLNLTKASYVFHIEPWWNPAVENQATDRAHRIGQVQMVQVIRYIIKESVEEKIEVLKDVKSKRFDALFSVSEGEGELGPAGSTLSQSDF